jgi:hypothetical protein
VAQPAISVDPAASAASQRLELTFSSPTSFAA